MPWTAATLISILCGAALLVTSPAHAEDPRPGRRGLDLFVTVPLEHDSSVVFPRGGSHHAVPGVVAVNRDPYVCVVHERPFRDRTAFVEHLRTRHRVDDDVIRENVLVRGGQVRYVGE